MKYILPYCGIPEDSEFKLNLMDFHICSKVRVFLIGSRFQNLVIFKLQFVPLLKDSQSLYSTLL